MESDKGVRPDPEEDDEDDIIVENEDDKQTTAEAAAAEEEEEEAVPIKPAKPSSRSMPTVPPKPVSAPTFARPRPQLRKPASRHVDSLDDQAAPELRQPTKVIQGKKKSIIGTAWPSITLLCGAIMIAVALVAIFFPSGFGSEPVKKMPSMFYELTDNVWPKQCTPLTVEEIQAGKIVILSKEVKLADLRDSLIHHIEERGEDGLCAQNLEKKPICYCVLATNSSTQPYLEIYNMIRVGDSFPLMQEISEEHIFCKHPVLKMRYNHVTVRFHMPNGQPDRQRFEAPQSYTIQSFDDMLRGVSRCEDNKEQLMMHDIHDGVRYLSREQMYKEYNHMLRVYPEGLLPDVQIEDRYERRALPSLPGK